MNSKFQQELKALNAADIISDDTLLRIQQYYNTNTKEKSNRLLPIFGVLGSLLVGLGLILIVAHNWDIFSRTTRTIWAFIPLLIGQFFVGFSLLKRKGKSWREASATFLIISIGVTISLVSQIYNIPGSFSTFLLSWILLAAPVLYLMRSYAAALIYLFMITIYAIEVGYFTGSKIPWLYIPLLLWAIPYYLIQLKKNAAKNSLGILNWLFPISLAIVLGAFIPNSEHLALLIYTLLFGTLYLVSKFPLFSKQKLITNGYAAVGSLGTVCTLSFGTFMGFWESSYHQIIHTPSLLIVISGILLGLGLLAYLYKNKLLALNNLFGTAFLVFAIVFLFRGEDPYIPTILSNFLLFGLGISAIHLGSKHLQYSTLNYGLLIITLQITYRFFDTEISFVIRGVLFILIGLGFFLTNYILFRKQRIALKQETH